MATASRSAAVHTNCDSVAISMRGAWVDATRAGPDFLMIIRLILGGISSGQARGVGARGSGVVNGFWVVFLVVALLFFLIILFILFFLFFNPFSGPQFAVFPQATFFFVIVICFGFLIIVFFLLLGSVPPFPIPFSLLSPCVFPFSSPMCLLSFWYMKL